MNYLTLDTSKKLADYCALLNHQAWFAIDTEFIRQETYYAELSLVQICTDQGELALIDPLAVEDLTPLWQLLANPNVIKVFHSARQDIEVLYQIGGLMPQAIFDTQIASVFMGHGDLVGLARVIEAELGHVLDKAQTRTNWHQRPLHEKQIQYALDDVRYLAPLYQKILHTLTPEQLDALKWDFNQLLNPALYDIDPEQVWLRLKGTASFTPKQLGIVKTLCSWRERKAIEINQPRRWVLSDEAIFALAKRPISVLEGLYKIKELNAGLVRQFGEDIIEQIDHAFSHPDSWPERPKKLAPTTPEEEPLIHAALSYAQQQALNHKINLTNLIQKQDLIQLLRHNTGGLTLGWRKVFIGDDLTRLFNHQACLCIKKQQLVLTPN